MHLHTQAGIHTGSHLLPGRHCRPPQILSQHPTSPHSVSLKLYSWSSGGQHLLPHQPELLFPTLHLDPGFSYSPAGGRVETVQCLSPKHSDLSLIPSVIRVEVAVYAGNYRAGEAGVGGSLGLAG